MSQTVPSSTTLRKPPYPAVAYHATYHNAHGVALRTTEGRVYFRNPLGLWSELFDHDAPALQLHGRLDVIAEQQLRDALHGNLYQQIIYRNTEQARKAA